LHRLRLDLANAFARQSERVADGGECHRRGAVEAEPAHDDRAPLRRKRLRGAVDQRRVFGADQRVEGRPRQRIDQDVVPPEGAPRADRLVERDVLAKSRLPVL